MRSLSLLACLGALLAEPAAARPRGGRFAGRGRRKPREAKVMYLPEYIGEERTLNETNKEGVYLIQNKNLSATTKGLGYRYGPNLEEKSGTMTARWGSKLKGNLTDGFLRVDNVGYQFEHELVARELRKLHRGMDLDRDGNVTSEEIAKFHHDSDAQIFKRESKKLFKQVDRNFNGKVTVKEACKAKSSTFAVNNTEENVKLADTNSDGVLSREEFTALLRPGLNESVLAVAVKDAVAEVDSDGDGVVSRAEFDSAGNAFLNFDELDTDGDGSLSAEEYTPLQTGHHHTKVTLARIIDMADANKDGNTTVAEWIKAWDLLEAADESNAHKKHLKSWKKRMCKHTELNQLSAQVNSKKVGGGNRGGSRGGSRGGKLGGKFGGKHGKRGGKLSGKMGGKGGGRGGGQLGGRSGGRSGSKGGIRGGNRGGRGGGKRGGNAGGKQFNPA